MDSTATSVADGEENDAVEPVESNIPMLIEVDPAAARSMGAALHAIVISDTAAYTDSSALSASADGAPVRVELLYDPSGGRPAYEQLFVPASRFDTIEPEIEWLALQNAWQGRPNEYERVVILTDTLTALVQVLGDPSDRVFGVATPDDAVAAAWHISPTLTILPFETLVPSLAPLAIEGEDPLDNRFDAESYPLIASVYAHDDAVSPDQSARVGEFLAKLPESNRAADQLTVIAMTGVTAMVRGTAAKLDEFGPGWAAEVIGPDLSDADITHISNEVPFVSGCKTNTNPENLTFCSHPDYLETLEDVGVDIIGLTGNHQNDYGYDGAIESIEFYEASGLPVYGGGVDRESALEPLLLEHNGNKLAFLGANAFGPRFAWATEFYPGSLRFDLTMMSATIRSLKEAELADVVLTELQYQERYNVEPLNTQRLDFGALTRAGADIVTGVQSHVPQAVEFVDGRLINYGLGNLFFDQMLDQETREGIVAFHTIYDGRHIGTRLRTTMLYDYGQPQWTTPEENEAILKRVFDASYWEY